MSEQFSKLNKLGHSFASKRPIDIAKSIGKKSDIVDGIKPTFTVGKREISGQKIDKSDDCSDNSSVSDCEEHIEIIPVHTERPNDFYEDKKLMESYTPSIGIIMGVQKDVDEVGKDIATEDHPNSNHSAVARSSNQVKPFFTCTKKRK